MFRLRNDPFDRFPPPASTLDSVENMPEFFRLQPGAENGDRCIPVRGIDLGGEFHTCARTEIWMLFWRIPPLRLVASMPLMLPASGLGAMIICLRRRRCQCAVVYSAVVRASGYRCAA